MSTEIDRPPGTGSRLRRSFEEAYEQVADAAEGFSRAVRASGRFVAALWEEIERPDSRRRLSPLGVAAFAGGVGLALARGAQLEPVEALPAAVGVGGGLAVALTAIVWWSFGYLLRESRRSERRHVVGAATPAVEEQLLREERRRVGAARRLPPGTQQALEDLPIVQRAFQQARELIRRGPDGQRVYVLLVRADGDGSRYEVVADSGPVEDDHREGRVWTFTEVFRGGDAFAAIVEEFEYERDVTAFELGDRAYFLVVVSGVSLADDSRLVASQTATALVEVAVAEANGLESDGFLEELR